MEKKNEQQTFTSGERYDLSAQTDDTFFIMDDTKKFPIYTYLSEFREFFPTFSIENSEKSVYQKHYNIYTRSIVTQSALSTNIQNEIQ